MFPLEQLVNTVWIEKKEEKNSDLRSFAVALSPGCIPLQGDRNDSVADLNEVGGEFIHVGVDKLSI